MAVISVGHHESAHQSDQQDVYTDCERYVPTASAGPGGGSINQATLQHRCPDDDKQGRNSPGISATSPSSQGDMEKENQRVHSQSKSKGKRVKFRSLKVNQRKQVLGGKTRKGVAGEQDQIPYDDSSGGCQQEPDPNHETTPEGIPTMAARVEGHHDNGSSSKHKKFVNPVVGKVLYSAQDDAEVEILGSIKISFGECDNPEILWLVDTGATRSIISTATYRKYLQRIPLEKTCIPMTAINGSKIPVLGKCVLTVVLNGKEYVHNFIVAGIDDAGVLGRDFLRTYRCYWNWEHNVLDIDGQEIKCRVPVTSDVPTVNVQAPKSYFIPANSEMIVQGTIVGEERPLTTGLVTGLSQFMRKRQVGVAATLARRQGKFVPIRVLNPSGRKRFTGMGDVMATYQAVDVLEATGRQKTRSAREESVD